VMRKCSSSRASRVVYAHTEHMHDGGRQGSDNQCTPERQVRRLSANQDGVLLNSATRLEPIVAAPRESLARLLFQ